MANSGLVSLDDSKSPRRSIDLSLSTTNTQETSNPRQSIMSKQASTNSTKCAFALASLKNLLELFDEDHLDVVCNNDWLKSTASIAVSSIICSIDTDIIKKNKNTPQRDAMGVENVRNDKQLRGLVLRAFESITDLSDRIEQGYLTSLFNIFNIMYPVLDEAKNNPPENVSENMRKLLQDVVQQDEGLQDDNSDDESDNSDDESDNSDDGDSEDDSDSDDSDESDGAVTKR